jgi:hypothetical protein
MSDSRRCSSADSENILEKITKIYWRHFEVRIFPKVSKTVGILEKTLKNVF